METQNNNLTSLPEKWCVIATNDEEAEIMMLYANKLNQLNSWDLKDCKYFHLHIKDGKYDAGNRNQLPNYIKLTFEQFERWVLNKKPKYQLWKLKIQS